MTSKFEYPETKSRSASVDNSLMPIRVYPQLCVVKDHNINRSPRQSNASDKSSIIESPSSDTLTDKKVKKEKIPQAVREQVWIKYSEKNTFERKCYVKWCNNIINPFNFHVGHNIPEINGGTLDIDNLRSICARCNLSMGSNYTIDEWSKIVHSEPIKNKIKCTIM